MSMPVAASSLRVLTRKHRHPKTTWPEGTPQRKLETEFQPLPQLSPFELAVIHRSVDDAHADGLWLWQVGGVAFE